MTIALSTLLVRVGKAAFYSTALSIAESVGLPVSTWQAGDPTRSLYHLESEILDKLELDLISFIKSRFLDEATGVWLKVKAEQDYNVTVPGATYATTTVRLTNAGGGLYEIEAGDLTFKNTATGKTYRNTTGGILASGPGTTLDVTVVADESGSDSSAGVGEIDELVTALLGVSCTNATPAVGVDEQDEAVTRQQCRDKLGSFSPNGPKEAYAYVARNAELTGTSAVTKVRVYADSDTGDVTVYLAGPAGGVQEADRALVEEAILEWATPLCITPTVLATTNAVVPVTYTLWIYKSVNKSAAEVAEAVEEALEQMLADLDIGGDIVTGATTGKLYKSKIESAILSTFPEGFRVSVSSPAGDTDLTNGQTASLGSVTPTINIVVAP